MCLYVCAETVCAYIYIYILLCVCNMYFQSPNASYAHRTGSVEFIKMKHYATNKAMSKG